MSVQIAVRNVARWTLFPVVLAISSCGGSGGGASLSTADVAAAACRTAFDDASTGVVSKLGMSLKEDEPLPAAVVSLSQCPMDAARNVAIGEGGCGPRVVIDKSFVGAEGLGKITIKPDGRLAVPRVFNTLEVHTAGIGIEGVLSIGTAACPVGLANPGSRMKIVLTGSRGDAATRSGVNDGSDKGIEVRAGGSLRLYGAKGVAPQGVSWTHLSRPAGPPRYQRADLGVGVPVEPGGERTLHLAKNVLAEGAWSAGDWIVVATSSFSPFESEFVQIESLAPNASGGTTVSLAQPLRHYHFGGADPGPPSEANYGAGRDTNYGVDERSEVGLISRNIILTAQTPRSSADEDNPDVRWGGEIRILKAFAEASIQGVELEKFGKERLGSYPIHFHMAGDATGRQLLNSNSIHHSYNKCVALHSTNGVLVQNNVCARAVGHLFYQEMGDEQSTRFVGNLGVGAMSHYFGIDVDSGKVPKTGDGLVQNWWEGDYLARANGYDGLNVRNTDNQANPTRGRCFYPDPNLPGRLTLRSDPPCARSGDLYVEQATGFWIVNPATEIRGNSIAGCQGMGKGYWYVPPQGDGALYPQRFQPLGAFVNNRVHGCYDGLFGETDIGAVSQQLFPTAGGKSTAELDAVNVISRFAGFTATRIRNRGVWMRPMWTAVEQGRFATNRDSVSLVSSGGNDGNAPGVWALLKDSVLVGVSMNNVDRWGPCPELGDGSEGCVDVNPKANELFEHGYQTPRWNSAGYMIYDGPVRIIRNHFVNYLRDVAPLLTVEDRETMKRFRAYPNPSASRYEGDAALGWFQNNQSAYPTATVSRALSFDNVDLRHQIYTEKANLGDFRDGDKNTALVDLDGTLTGYRVVDAAGMPAPGHFPISLNNLPFNRSGNAVDECHAEGQQDADLEGRATSIISPASTATLEFEAQHPASGATWQDMTFTKDSVDAGAHQSMTLLSRNGQGVWEPKVASGRGYTVRASATTAPGQSSRAIGIPRTVRVGFTDAVKPGMDSKPFFVRVGVCYSNKDNLAPPNGNFSIRRGYKSWGGNGVSYNNPALQPYFNFLANRYDGQNCYNLDHQNPANLDAIKGCPAEGVIPLPGNGICPAPSVQRSSSSAAQPVCMFPRETLTPATSLGEITRADGTPADFSKYYYDASTGMLFFYVVQDHNNARGVAPLGSCPGDPACPDESELETYYSCPPQGCINYAVELKDESYEPGPSRCDELAAGGSIYGDGRFVLPEPVDDLRLAYVEPGGAGVSARASEIVAPTVRTTRQGFTHWTADREPWCPLSSAPSPFTQRLKTSFVDGKVSDTLSWLQALVAPDLNATAQWRSLLSSKSPRDIELLASTEICAARP